LVIEVNRLISVGVPVVDARCAEALQSLDGTARAALARTDQPVAAFAVRIPLAPATLTWTSGAGITTAVVFHDAVDAFLRFEAGAGRTIWAPLTVRRHSIHADGEDDDQDAENADDH